MAQQTDNPVDENGYPVYGTFRQPTKQQTAVEWLWRWQMDNEFASFKEGVDAYKRAKAMEKEQILNAYGDGQANGIECQTKLSNGYDCNVITSIQYYNETYNK
jgi:hypothetical protein